MNKENENLYKEIIEEIIEYNNFYDPEISIDYVVKEFYLYTEHCNYEHLFYDYIRQNINPFFSNKEDIFQEFYSEGLEFYYRLLNDISEIISDGSYESFEKLEYVYGEKITKDILDSIMEKTKEIIESNIDDYEYEERQDMKILSLDEYLEKYLKEESDKDFLIHSYLEERAERIKSFLSYIDRTFAYQGYNRSIIILEWLYHKTGDERIPFVVDLMELVFNNRLAKTTVVESKDYYAEKEKYTASLINRCIKDKNFVFKYEEKEENKWFNKVIYFWTPFTGKQISIHSSIDIKQIFSKTKEKKIEKYIKSWNIYPSKIFDSEELNSSVDKIIERIIIDSFTKSLFFYSDSYKETVKLYIKDLPINYGKNSLYSFFNKFVKKLKKAINKEFGYIDKNIISISPSFNCYIDEGRTFDILEEEVICIFEKYKDILQTIFNGIYSINI